jgi:hypothetical protein
LGERFFPLNEASKHLTGVALELSPAPGFLPKDERARLPFSTFWRELSGNTHALAQILILSIVLEGFVIASPFYLQLTVDEVIARGDVDLLIVLAQLPDVGEFEAQWPAGELHLTPHLNHGPERHAFQRYRMATPERVQVDAVAVIRANHGEASKSTLSCLGLSNNWNMALAAEIHGASTTVMS